MIKLALFLLIVLCSASLPVSGQTYTSMSTTTFPMPAAGSRVITGDFDNDGDDDILYQTSGNGTAFQYALNNGDGTFTILAQASSPFAGFLLPDNAGTGNYKAVDFDNDGDIDLIVFNGSNSLYLRNDKGVFTSQSTSTFPQPTVTTRTIMADFDNDGYPDVLYQTGGNSSAFQYARNNKNGTFTILALAASPFAGCTLPDVAGNGFNYAAEDFDGDGDIDLWIAVSNATGSYFRNDKGKFSLQSSSTFPAPQSSTRIVCADFDSDGDADILYQTGGNNSAFQYARNNGDGTFTIMALSASPFAGLSLPDHNGSNYRTPDFDGDTDIDLYVSLNGVTPSYFMQNGAPPLIVGFSPARNALMVGIETNIVWTFSQVVTKGTGNIYIKKVSDSSIVETIKIDSSQVSGAGKVWTIAPSKTLQSNTQYYVIADKKIFANATGAIFKGMSKVTDYSFITGSALPVNFISFRAYKRDYKIITEWETAAEKNLYKYEVQKSATGTLFEKVGEVQPNLLHKYNWADKEPFAGNNFYRIRSIDLDGKEKFSSVVSVSWQKEGKGIAIHPSTINTNQFKIQVNGIGAGNYTLDIINARGQILYRQKIIYSGLNNSLPVTLPTVPAKGNYWLRLYNNKENYQVSIVVE